VKIAFLDLNHASCGVLAKFLFTINKLLILISSTLFSYQIFMLVNPRSSLEFLLRSSAEVPEKKLREVK
jgi:hypothetical protein